MESPASSWVLDDGWEKAGCIRVGQTVACEPHVVAGGGGVT